MIAAAVGCGGNSGAGGDGDGDGDGDAGTGTGDLPECSNGIDDDGDGDIDGDDIHCISADDDDESSFETGIPGDNVDAVKQDCFFDGDSGAGNDGCDLHVCCLLDAADQAECDAFGQALGFDPKSYDPASDCQVSQECVDFCQGISPPGCDCFGCCTICNGTDCRDVVTHPDLAPNCDKDTLDDPNECPPCTQVEECINECDQDPCVLCPGQDPSDLPPECNGQNECTNGYTACDTTADCAVGESCLSNCCIPQVD